MSDGSTELQARFTGWLKTLLLRARVRYIQKISCRMEICSLEMVPESVLSYDGAYSDLENERNEVLDFEEKRLAKAFSELPLMKREVLRLLYYDELNPQEIAESLGCSLQHIYNQKSRALKILRRIMSESDEK